MRLCTFDHQKHREIGLLDGAQVVRLKAFDPTLPSGLKSFLARDNWRQVCAAALASTDPSIRIGALRVTMHTPIPQPGQLFQINLNFPTHCAERGVPIPEYPQIFSKYGTRILGNEEDVTGKAMDCGELRRFIRL